MTSAGRLPVAAAVLRASRRSVLLWSLALLAVVAVYVPVFTAYEGTGTLDAQVEALPTGVSGALGLEGLGSAAGYVQSTVFGLLGMLLLLVLALSAGAQLVGGDEEAGHLALLLAAPLTRRRLVLERALALAVLVGVPGAVVTAAVVALTGALGLDVPVGGVVRAGAALTLLSFGAGALALAAGCVRGRRAVALGAAAGTTVALYLVNAVAPQVEAVAWAGELSPFSWYLQHNTITTGPSWGHLLGLALLGPLLVAAGAAALARRDVGT